MNYRIKKKRDKTAKKDYCEKFIDKLKTKDGKSCREEYEDFIEQINLAVEKAYAENFPIHNFCFIEIGFYCELIGCGLLFSNEKEEVYFFVNDDFEVEISEILYFSNKLSCFIPRKNCVEAVSSAKNKNSKAIILSEKIEYDNIIAKDTISNLDNNVDNDEWYKLLFDYEEYSAMINIRHLLYEVAQKALRDKFPIENYFVMGRPIHSFKDKTYFIRFCNQADHNREIIFLINHFEEPLKRAIPYKRVNGNLQACKTCWEAVKEG